MIKVLNDNVLVEETFVNRSSSLILPDKKKMDDDVYEVFYKVISVGEDVKNIEVGNIPVIAKWARTEPLFTTIIEGKQGDQKVIRNSIFKSEVIIGIEEK